MVTTTMDNRENRSAITFNAAGVGVFTKLSEGGMLSGAIIDAFIMATDPLNAVQTAVTGLSTANGNKHFVKPNSWNSIKNGHSIKNMVKDINNE